MIRNATVEKGVLRAVANVDEKISRALMGMNAVQQALIDRCMIDLDGTENKSNLGANAILGVSMAVARAAAASVGISLYRYLGGAGARRLPVPCMNILNGGEHADNSVDFQEFMRFPWGRRPSGRVFGMCGNLPRAEENPQIPRSSHQCGRRGRLCANLDSNEAAMEIIHRSHFKGGYKPGVDIAIAIDSAASSFSLGRRDPMI